MAQGSHSFLCKMFWPCFKNLHPCYFSFCLVFWRFIGPITGFRVCLFHQLTITADSCSISLQQNTVFKKLFLLNKNCYLWQVLLDFIIQKYPQWCLVSTLHNSITSEKIQITKYTNVIKYTQYMKNACIGNSAHVGQ